MRRSSPYFCFDFLQFVADDIQNELLVGQNRFVFGDFLQQFGVFALRSSPAPDRSAAADAYPESPALAHATARSRSIKPFARFFRRSGSADQRDHFVEMVESDAQAFQNMRAGFRFLQIVFSAAANNFDLVLQIMMQHIAQIEHLRLAVHERQHIDAEIRLHRRMLVQIVQHDIRVDIAAKLDDDAHAVAVGFVAQIGNAVDLLLAHEFGDFLDQPRLVDLIRQFVTMMRALPSFSSISRLGPHRDRTAACRDKPGGCLHGPE